MSDDENGFESARSLLEGTEADIAQIKVLIHDFLTAKPYVFRTEINPMTQSRQVKLILNEVPPRIRYVTSNVIKNLRDALDQACWAASSYIRGKPCRNAHFPFGENPSDFEDALRLNKCKDIPVEMHPVLKSFEPYPTGDGYNGGNNHLRLLGRVSGPHKHQFALGTRAHIPNIAMTNFDIYSGHQGTSIFPFLDRKKENELVILDLGPGGNANLNVSFSTYVAFNNKKLKDVNVLNFINLCFIDVKNIVQILEAEAVKIGPRNYGGTHR